MPPIGAFLPGYEGSGWAGVGAPHGTPADVISTLNPAINAALADPALRARCIALGAVPEPMTPSQFGTLIANAAVKWAKVISFRQYQSGLKGWLTRFFGMSASNDSPRRARGDRVVLARRRTRQMVRRGPKFRPGHPIAVSADL